MYMTSVQHPLNLLNWQREGRYLMASNLESCLFVYDLRLLMITQQLQDS
jgi:hypothetical protein